MSAEPQGPHEYWFDLRHKATQLGPAAADGARVIAKYVADPTLANPVDILQFGLGALQLRDPDWYPSVAEAVAWVEREQDAHGLLAYRFPMPHTFPLDAPWHSSMAQGQAGSFLVRAAAVLGRSELVARAERAVASLLEPSSPLLLTTPDGPVLEEYPTSPSSYVLNGWITSLFGLRDVAGATSDPELARRAATAFDDGVATVARRLGLYDLALGWTRYDLFPHPLVNVASPAYHQVHIDHIRTLQAISPRPEFEAALGRWERAASSRVALSLALARKVAFRLVRPRSRQIRPRRN